MQAQPNVDGRPAGGGHDGIAEVDNRDKRQQRGKRSRHAFAQIKRQGIQQERERRDGDPGAEDVAGSDEEIVILNMAHAGRPVGHPRWGGASAETGPYFKAIPKNNATSWLA